MTYTYVSQQSSCCFLKANKVLKKIKQNLSLARKFQLHEIITNNNGSPDYLAINIYYDTLRSWYAPNKIKDADGNVITIKKLKTKGIYFSYKKLSELHGCSTETIRRKLVKLEKLGLIQRGFKHKETVTTKSYNQLIIYVWRHTPHFFNKYGIDQAEIGELKPQTNHKYIAEKYNIDYHSQIEQIKAVESKGGIHTSMDTKELIEPFNKLKDRSNQSNFYKNNFNLNSKNINTEFDKKTESFIDGSINNVDDSSVEVNNVSINTTKLQESITTSRASKNGFLGTGKYLSEILDHLTDEICEVIRSKCGKNYTDRAIKEIAKAVSRSKKGSKAFFYHIKGFIAYLSKILTFEKRDPVKINSINYYITANQTSEEQIIRKQEKYLTDIEYSLQVSPEWHLKKKLAATLERSKAYNILTSWNGIDITKDGLAKLNLTKTILLTDTDKKIILSQIQATHEKTRGGGDIISVNSLEFATTEKKILKLAGEHSKETQKREGTWGKIRESFASYFHNGNAIDKSWLSSFTTRIDKEKNTIELYAPTRFIKDWVESNYLSYIEDAARKNGLIIKCIK